MTLADLMASHAGISGVLYPGRSDHSDAGGVVGRVMTGPHGAMLTLVIAGGDKWALQVIRRLERSRRGHQSRRVSRPSRACRSTRHAFNMTPLQRIDAGILPGMLRLSVGLEGVEVLVGDLRQALDSDS